MFNDNNSTWLFNLDLAGELYMFDPHSRRDSTASSTAPQGWTPQCFPVIEAGWP
jgi:hypothetical protein